VLTAWALLTTFAAIPAFPSLTEEAPSITDLSTDLAVDIEPGWDAAAELLIPPAPRERSKKKQWLLDKTMRHDVHLADRDLQRGLSARPTPAAVAAAPSRPGTTQRPITTLYNMWTKEVLALVPGPQGQIQARFHPFLRDHYTNQTTQMDVRLIEVLAQVAKRFRADRIEVVSGYRSPKYNLMLRKKGRQVARASQHTEGHAVDFRVRGVPTPVLLKYVKSLRRGGVGFYPHSQFVHSDTGPIRFWKGS
jgi:uncharacterized protein YcbK (DUF882 family)